jgi:hypothetical protein
MQRVRPIETVQNRQQLQSIAQRTVPPDVCVELAHDQNLHANKDPNKQITISSSRMTYAANLQLSPAENQPSYVLSPLQSPRILEAKVTMNYAAQDLSNLRTSRKSVVAEE